MDAAVMQPYFLPYIGYWQLMAAVEVFVVYDDIEFSKGGWIRRNRILQEGRSEMVSIPLEKASNTLAVRDRRIAASFDREQLVRRIGSAYRRAPRRSDVMPLVEQVVLNAESNLFGYVHASIVAVREHLGITTELVVSSDLDIAPGLRGQERVLATCRAVGATGYVNPQGGTGLYQQAAFQRHGMDLEFIRPLAIDYPQLGGPHVPWLSIVDVLMFNAPAEVALLLGRSERFRV
jgi:hypothetical protein